MGNYLFYNKKILTYVMYNIGDNGGLNYFKLSQLTI